MSITFQLLDCDYFLNNHRPVIRMFGKTESGNPVCAFYDKYLPYFYVKPNERTEKRLKEIKEIIKIEETQKFLPLGYNKEPTKLLKLTLTNPQDVPRIRDKLIQEKSVDDLCEADILFKYRFMVDFGLRGLDWIEAEGEKAFTKTIKGLAFDAKKIKTIKRNENAKLKYLSFDIECLPGDARKPLDSKKDSMIMISLAFEPKYKNYKTLVLVAKPITGKDAQGFKNEKEMLEEFINIIDNFDPDVITGYNINSFDLPYLVERLKEHGISRCFGRCKDKQVFIKTFGIIQDCIVTGRIVVDPYQIIKRDPWLRFHRYNLNTIAKEMLNEEKLDVEYGDMPKLWNGSRKDMNKFVEYSRKDAELSLRLVLEKGLLDKFFELSKISGLLLQDSFGGQSTRVETMLLHEFKKRNFVMPAKPDKTELAKRARERKKKGLKGATVLEPTKGLHSEGCVLVLDFKSLYPSIMRTYNISPDSLLREKGTIKSYKSPNNSFFIDKEVREGIFPKVLTELLRVRGRVKSEMLKARGEEKRILNAKQLALKDMSNSYYGYTGYIRARLYMIDVANSITSYGRENIEKTKKLVEENFPIQVVYGDTDSIFLKTDITNLDDARELGIKISKYVNKGLGEQLELEFEKIYRTFLILTKKRYAGWKFELTDEGWKDEIEMRGIETIRRDWCVLVSESMHKIITIILKEGDVKKAIELLRKVLEDLKEGKVPLEKLTIIKGITKSLNSYEGTLPHIELAKKLDERHPHDPVKVGDRLGFVIIKGNQMLSKRAEDPKYVEQHNIPIDSEYYIHSQLFSPIERILSAVGITKSELLGTGRQINILDIMNGTKRKMKHEINLDFDKQKILEGCEGFVCKKCNKAYRRIPLQGVCECGGEILICYHGSTGKLIKKA